MCLLSELIIHLFKEVLSNELDFSNSGLLNFLRIESKLYFASYYCDLLYVCVSAHAVFLRKPFGQCAALVCCFE